MIAFWIVSALLTVVAVAFVLVPLLRGRAATGPSVRDANLAALRSQRRELDADVAHGLLPAEARDEAVADLVARASEDLAVAPDEPAAPPRRSWIPAAVFALLIPAGAVGIYLWVGAPGATDPTAVAAADSPFGDHKMDELVVQLAQKVKERPDDVQGWNLLARSYQAMGRMNDALAAYKHVATIAPNDAQALSDYADALALSRNRNLAGEPTELVMKALKADPKHPKSLALAGTAALNAGDFAASIGYWERLYLAVPPDSQDIPEIRNIIEDVRQRAAAAGKPQPPSKVLAAGDAPKGPPVAAAAPLPPPAPAPAPTRAGPSGKAIEGTVRLSDSLAGRITPTDTLFIYARAAQGSRMPLAILRGGARELPKAFSLDDGMGMAPNVKLSETPSVVIEARVSKAGNAMAQPGDLVGTSAPVAPGAKGVTVVIDKVLP